MEKTGSISSKPRATAHYSLSISADAPEAAWLDSQPNVSAFLRKLVEAAYRLAVVRGEA